MKASAPWPEEDDWQAQIECLGGPQFVEAVGRLALEYNELERTLFNVLIRLTPGEIPDLLRTFNALTNQERRDQMLQLVRAESDTAIREAVVSAATRFEKCATMRNQIIHSFVHDVYRGEVTLGKLPERRINKLGEPFAVLTNVDVSAIRSAGHFIFEVAQYCRVLGSAIERRRFFAPTHELPLPPAIPPLSFSSG